MSVTVSNRRLQVAIELEGGGAAGGAPGGRHARTVVDRALAYSVLEEETDGCWELLNVSSERLLVVTLTKSTEGWTFQSPYDTIWWDAVFAEQVHAVHVERMDREMHSLSHYFSSLSQTLRPKPLLPPPPPSARKGAGAVCGASVSGGAGSLNAQVSRIRPRPLLPHNLSRAQG